MGGDAIAIAAGGGFSPASYGALVDRVMANIPRARRDGVLQPPHR